MPLKEFHEDFVGILRNESPFYSTVNEWAAWFKRGRESVGNDGRSGYPKDATADENVKVVHTLVMCDRRRDLRSMPRVPGMLTDDQKRTRLDISMYLLSGYEDDSSNSIDLDVTQDNTWVHYFDPE